MEPLLPGHTVLAVLGALIAGISLLIATRLVYADRPTAGDQVWFVVRVIAITQITIATAAGFVVLAGMVGIAFWLIAAVILGSSFHSYRRMQQEGLLQVLATATAKSLPLAPVVEAYGFEQGGRFGTRVRRLAARLTEGQPLVAAMRESRRVVPSHTLLAATIGEKTGTLALALADAASNLAFYRPTWRAAGGRLLYWFWLLIFAFAVVGYLAFRINPQFQNIMADIGSEIPWLTDTVFQVISLDTMNPISRALVLLFFFLCVIVILPVVALLLVCNTMGWTQFTLPGVDRLIRRLHAAVILRALTLAAERKMPFPEMLQVLSAAYPVRLIGARLARASRRIEQGTPWCESLRQSRLLGSADAAVLQAAERVGNLAWALREMADSNERRLFYRLELFLQIASWFVTIFFAVTIGLVVIAYFLPLTRIIMDLS